MAANRHVLKSKNTVAFVILIIAFNFVMISMIQITLAETTNPGVYSIDSKPFGIPYTDWTNKWWQWLVSIPTPSNPVNDTTGKNCMVDQKGPVWFLAGPTAEYKALSGQHSVERSCTIPSGKAILFPVINSQCNFLQGYWNHKDPNLLYELKSCPKNNLIGVVNSSLKASIDGLKLQKLEKYQVASSPFNATFPKNNILGVKHGNSANTTMASNGFWVFLQPLAPANHELQFGGLTSLGYTKNNTDFITNTTYHLAVR
jgi:hypothetical protein